MVTLRINTFPPQGDLNRLWLEAWGSEEPKDFSGVLSRSLAHIACYEDDRLVGLVNVAWDGGAHALCYSPDAKKRYCYSHDTRIVDCH